MAGGSQACAVKQRPLQMVFVLHLAGAFLGDLQVLGLPLHRRDLFGAKELGLDMAPASFDDQYEGCAEAMEAELAELNRTEFARNRVYAEAWEEAAMKWGERRASLPLPPGLQPAHAIAVMAYTIQGRLHKEFNTAVREAGRTREAYLHHFDFKAFHFLLTRALRLLGSAARPRCHRVYRGVRNVRFTAERARTVRFGHFASASLRNDSALQFGTDTFFTIDTCHGASIRNFSFFPGEEEVLIPPFEKFKVANFTRAPETTFIQLLPLHSSSVYNCVFVQEKRCKTQRCRLDSGAGASHVSAGGWMPVLLWSIVFTGGALGLWDASLLGD